MSDAVDVHRGDKPGIIHQHTGYGVLDKELSPLVIGGHAIGEETEIALDHPDATFGRSGREPKAATGGRGARTYTPKLGQDLRGKAQDFVTPAEHSKRVSSDGVRRVGGIREAQQDVRIEEIGHLVLVGVDIRAGEIRRKGREVFRALGELVEDGLKLLVRQLREGRPIVQKAQEHVKVGVKREALRLGFLRELGFPGENAKFCTVGYSNRHR